MIIFHEYKTDRYGNLNQVTTASYVHEGHQKAASFAGWISKETAQQMLQLFRKNDRNAKRT